MKSYIKEEFKRAIYSLNTLIAFVLCFIVITISFTYTNHSFYLDNKNAVTAFLLIFRGEFATLFIIFASFIAALPYSHSYVTDKKSGFLKHMLVRIDKKKFFITRYFVNGIIGGLVLALSLLIVYIVLLIIFMKAPIPLPTGYDMETGAFGYYYNNYPVVFVFICILLLFCYGFIFSTLGLALGVFTENKYVSVVATLMVPVLVEMTTGGGFLHKFISTDIIFFPISYGSTTNTQVLGIELGWIFFATMLYVIGISRKVKDNV